MDSTPHSSKFFSLMMPCPCHSLMPCPCHSLTFLNVLVSDYLFKAFFLFCFVFCGGSGGLNGAGCLVALFGYLVYLVLTVC